MSSIFGGNQSKEQSSQSNLAYPYLQGALGGTVNNGANASGQLASLLGLNGDQGQNDAFKNWQNSTGYQFGLNQGVGALTSTAATKGLLNSGSTAKAVDTYGQNYANTQFQNYLNPLQNLMSGGNQAAGTIANAGQVSSGSKTSGSNNGGAGGFIGSLLTK